MRFAFSLLVVVCVTSLSIAQEESTSEKSDPLIYPVEMADYTVSVVDEAGKPIAGVEVVASGVRCEEDPGSWYAWPIKNAGKDNRRTTNQQGKASFRYPVKYGTPPDLLTLNKIDFNFSHPKFVASDKEADPRADVLKHEMVAGCPVMFSAVDPDGEPIEKLWAHMAGPGRDAKWVLEDQKIRTRSIPDGAWQTMLVAPQKDGRTLFSGILPTRFRKNSNVTIRGIKLKPGVRLAGRLDDAVPRPVANGRVVAWHLPKPRGRCFDKEDPSLPWSDVTDVNPDGSFEFASMPRTGVVQLIAICSGWIVKSEPRDGKPARGFFILGVLFDLDEMDIEEGVVEDLVVPMEKAGTLEVTVTKPDGSPLVDAQVATWPNQSLNKGGSQLLGACFPSIEIIKKRIAGKEWDWMAAFRSSDSRYTQRTDKNGKCVLPDLPVSRNLSLHVEHKVFQVKSKGDQVRDRNVSFLLTEDDPAQKLEVQVEPIPEKEVTDE